MGERPHWWAATSCRATRGPDQGIINKARKPHQAKTQTERHQDSNIVHADSTQSVVLCRWHGVLHCQYPGHVRAVAGVDARRGLVTLATRAHGSDQVFRMRVASLDDSRTATTEVRGCKNAEPVLGGPGGTCRAVASAGGPKAAWGRQGGSSVRHGPSETGVAWGSVIGATGEVRPADMMRVFFMVQVHGRGVGVRTARGMACVAAAETAAAGFLRETHTKHVQMTTWTLRWQTRERHTGEQETSCCRSVATRVTPSQLSHTQHTHIHTTYTHNAGAA